MISHREHRVHRESGHRLTLIYTEFAWLGVLDEPCFLSELSRRIRHRPPCGQKKGPTFSSQAKDTDLTGGQLKANTALHKESAKIEFKVI
jgi:hypothetical protein